MSFQTQSESTECGFACIAITLEKPGALVDLSKLRRKHVISARGSIYGGNRGTYQDFFRVAPLERTSTSDQF